MNDAPVTRAEFEALKKEVELLRLDLHVEVRPQIEEHDDRLDEHDLQLGKIVVQLHAMVSEQHRLADAVTSQCKTLLVIHSHTLRLLQLLEVESAVKEVKP